MSYTYSKDKKARRNYDNRVEAVIVSKDYGDFLAETLPYNLSHFDRVVVVTDPDDSTTIEVCKKWSVEYVITDAFTEKGDLFNKGHAINLGIAAIRQLGWVIQMDADVVLPVTFRNMLDKSALNPEVIYGCERVNVTGWNRWVEVKQNMHTTPQFGYCYMVSTPPDLPIGANLVHKQYGYCPIGFFQLWHSSYMHRRNLRYPDTEGSAENMDVQWAIRWARKNRLLLPTVRVFHLDSEVCPMGTNWHGRRTKPFTPDGNPLVLDETPNSYGY